MWFSRRAKSNKTKRNTEICSKEEKKNSKTAKHSKTGKHVKKSNHKTARQKQNNKN